MIKPKKLLVAEPKKYSIEHFGILKNMLIYKGEDCTKYMVGFYLRVWGHLFRGMMGVLPQAIVFYFKCHSQTHVFTCVLL